MTLKLLQCSYVFSLLLQSSTIIIVELFPAAKVGFTIRRWSCIALHHSVLPVLADARLEHESIPPFCCIVRLIETIEQATNTSFLGRLIESSNAE